jgi:intein/homing endonuclease
MNESLIDIEVNELQKDLNELGFDIDISECQKAIEIMKTNNKDAAAQFLRDLGIPISKKTEKINGTTFHKWCVNNFVLMCG